VAQRRREPQDQVGDGAEARDENQRGDRRTMAHEGTTQLRAHARTAALSESPLLSTACTFTNSVYQHTTRSDHGWLVGVEFNAPLDTIEVISEAVFTANHLTDTDKQNSTGEYR